MICILSSPSRRAGWCELPRAADALSRTERSFGARAPLPIPLSSIMRWISAMASALRARGPVILHCRQGPLSSGPVMNCTRHPVSASTRLRFSPFLPIIKPTKLDSIEIDSTLSPSAPLPIGDRSRTGYPLAPSPRRGGENVPGGPLARGTGEKDRSLPYGSLVGGARSPRRSSR